jgi:hypothetical protein
MFSRSLGSRCLGGVEGPELGPFGNTSTWIVGVEAGHSDNLLDDRPL